MVQIISGDKGKGKTKYLLDKANTAITTAHGDIVYVDKNSSKMHELSNKIRLIDLSGFPVRGYDGFLGFIYGIISQNYDLEQIYLDSFLKLSRLNAEDIAEAIGDLEKIGDQHHVDFILSVSADNADLPKAAQDRTIIAL